MSPVPSDRIQAIALLTEEIRQLKGSAARIIYELGSRLARVADEELWYAGGYESFEAYLERGVEVSRATAYRSIRVARHFNGEICERYGVEKLILGLRYMEATPADERPGDLLAADIRIRDARGRFMQVPFHDATTDQIREAIGLVCQARSGGRALPSDVRSRVEALEARLPQAPKGTGGSQRVRVVKGKDGRLAVTFKAIPLDELEGFWEAVREELVEAP